MRLASHQLYLFPWPGFYDKMRQVDLFDLALWDQQQKNGYMHRVEIGDAEAVSAVGGWPASMRKDVLNHAAKRHWFTLPIDRYLKPCYEVRFRAEEESSQHATRLWKDLEATYERWPFWSVRATPVWDWLHVYVQGYAPLWPALVSSIVLGREWLRIDTPMAVWKPIDSRKTDNVMSMAIRYALVESVRHKAVVEGRRTMTYVSGQGAKAYLDAERMERETGIGVEWQEPGPEAYRITTSVLDCWFGLEDPTAACYR